MLSRSSKQQSSWEKGGIGSEQVVGLSAPIDCQDLGHRTATREMERGSNIYNQRGSWNVGTIEPSLFSIRFTKCCHKSGH